MTASRVLRMIRPIVLAVMGLCPWVPPDPGLDVARAAAAAAAPADTFETIGL